MRINPEYPDPDKPETIFFEYDLDDIKNEMAVFALFIEDYCCEEHNEFALAKMNFLIEAEQVLEGYEDVT